MGKLTCPGRPGNRGRSSGERGLLCGRAGLESGPRCGLLGDSSGGELRGEQRSREAGGRRQAAGSSPAAWRASGQRGKEETARLPLKPVQAWLSGLTRQHGGPRHRFLFPPEKSSAPTSLEHGRAGASQESTPAPWRCPQTHRPAAAIRKRAFP